jgi:membrane protein DedA with SNARE-associated domain
LLNPESCILRSADSFYRRGRALLVIAKFIPGINTLAPPLAGSMNMRFVPFLRLDLAGASPRLEESRVAARSSSVR